jgi:DNA repair protein RadA/Sms
MAKSSLKYVCQECGTVHPKWIGKCEGCNAWNSLAEEVIQSQKKSHNHKIAAEFVPIEGATQEVLRFITGINEFDRVCGGGLVPGSVILVGGDPGIGKSTLLLQVVAQLSHIYPCVYVSGEEAVAQVRLRAKRLGLSGHQQLHLAASTNVQEILNGLPNLPTQPKLMVIDSIQTMNHDAVESAPGTVTQVRACTHELITAAKNSGLVVILVGHVTKEGVIAGPRILEHMVDTVLYFEGDRHYHYRILRAVKNRFGATDEIGVFEMMGQGLAEVPNPSALFINDHQANVSGSAIFAGLEGTRPLLTEVQALVSPSYFTAPKRTSVGWDSSRLSMILAVLETRCGLSFANKDVYLNVAGGLRINEPAADLAVAAALISANKNIPVPHNSIFFGEIGLAGEIRGVNHPDLRLKEAAKLGFEQAFCAHALRESSQDYPLQQSCLRYLLEMLDFFSNSAHIKNKKRLA